MSWFPTGSINEKLLAIYNNNIRDRVRTLKKAKRVRQYAEEVAFLDPSRLSPADIYIISQINLDYQLFKESDLIMADVESFIPIWLASKQDKTPFPVKSLLEDLL